MSEFSPVILIILAVAVALALFYILSKTSLNNRTRNWIRGLLFVAMMSFLSYDFYRQGKYGLIIVIALGSIGFVVMLLKNKPRNQ